MSVRICHKWVTAASALAWCLLAPPQAFPDDNKSAVAKGPKVTYEDHVKAIFREKCFACHNTDKKTAGLDLTNYAGAMTGGGSGPVINPGSAGDSYLFSLVSHQSEPHMPPKSDKLPADMLATISKWIDGGALETAGSKAALSKKPKVDLALKGAPVGRPAGAPPMPEHLSLEPVIRTARATASRTVAVNPWSPLAALAGQKQVLLYNTKTLELVGVLPFPEGVPQVLKFSQNGLLLLAGGGRGAASGRVVVWNVKTGERIFEVGEELDSVLGADISADQSLIALGGPSKVVRVYSTADGSLKSTMKKHTDWVTAVAFSPDGVLLATADRNGGVVIWEAQTGREYAVLAGHASAVTSVAWRIDSNLVATSSEDTNIKLWEPENGNQVKSWAAHGGGVTSIAFTRDGRLVSCGRDGIAKLWDQNGAAKQTYSGFGDLPLCIAYCDETNRLVAGDWTGAIRVFNGPDGKQLGVLDADPPTLVERLDTAKKSLAAREAEHTQLAERLKSAKAESTKRHAELEAARKELASAEVKWNTDAGAAAKDKAAADVIAGEINSTPARIAALEGALPPLKVAAEKSALALTKIAGDKDLTAAAAQVKALLAQKTKELEDTKHRLPELKKTLDKARGTQAASEKHLAALKPGLESLRKRALDPATPVQAAFDASAQSLARAQHDVSRWSEEIAFRDKAVLVAAAQAKAAQLAEAVQSAQTAYDAAKAEVTKLEQSVTNAIKEAEAAATGLKKAQDFVVQLGAEQQAALRHAAIIDTLVPALGEALTKAEEAARRGPGEADVAGQVNELKQLISKKTTESELLKKTAAEKPKAIESARGQVVAAEKKLVESKSAIDAAKKKVLDAQAGLKPFEERIAAAKAKAGEGTKTLEAAKKNLEASAPHRAA
ncbi:MAG TPA: c-type cytochrome domain-containing protein [Planctomycetaceae bacterium]|nr:c-type cytochrome domain-containing protein [Planctomycetaceae bacterium]